MHHRSRGSVHAPKPAFVGMSGSCSRRHARISQAAPYCADAEWQTYFVDCASRFRVVDTHLEAPVTVQSAQLSLGATAVLNIRLRGAEQVV